MMSDQLDILLWGIYFCDLIFTGLPHNPRLGAEIYSRDFTMIPGGCYNTAVALHRLSLRVGWACDFGNDLFSQFVLERARSEGIDTRLFTYHPYPVRRITTAFSFAHDRGFISFTDEVDQTSAIPFIERYQPQCLLLPHLHLGERYKDLFTAAHQNNVLIFMDCQSIDVTLDTLGVKQALRSVDIFSPNQTEALQLTGARGVEDALAILSQFTPIVVIKTGSEGAIAQSGNDIIQVPSLAVQVVDTTGAGDCFNAGFLYAYLVKKASMKKCLQAANYCGGISTMAVGGSSIPDVKQMEEYLKQIE
jgi:sugar/nucleoside kinase (ribokinase family)